MGQDVGRARFETSTIRGARMVLVASAVLLVVASWYPFQLDSPWFHRSSPERSVAASGTTVAFDGTALLHSDGETSWMTDARESGRLSVVVVARTDLPQQYGPARVLRWGQDISEANLMIGQQDDDLHIRVRRAGSATTGEPAYVLDDFFLGHAPRTAELRIDGGRLSILLDGALLIDDDAGAPILDGWAEDHSIAVGDEPEGERGWVGELERLELRSGTTTVDLLAPGALEVAPERDLHPRIREDAGFELNDPPLLAVARPLALMPLGAALYVTSVSASTRARRWLLRALFALPVVLMVGKVVIAGRHPSPVNTSFEILGALLGYALAAWWVGRRRPVALSAPD